MRLTAMDTLEALAKATGLTVPDLVGESRALAHSELSAPVPLIDESASSQSGGKKGAKKGFTFRVPGHMAANTRAAA